MTIFWCGGEEIDFQLTMSCWTEGQDPNYARTNIQGYGTSKEFTPLTSCWLTFVFFHWWSGTNVKLVGVAKNRTNMAGLYVGVGSTYTIGLYKFDGSTQTLLGQEATPSLDFGTWGRATIQLINYGTNGTIIVYYNGIPRITYTGDLTIPGVSDFSSVGVYGSGHSYNTSEIIIADEDTRMMRVKTLVPNANGDINQWTNSYTEIDEINVSTGDTIYSATNNAEFQCGLTGLPAGNFSIKAVKETIYCVDGVGNMGVQIGVKTNGTVNVDSTETTPSGYWESKERLMELNPVTGLAWTPSEIENLQLSFKAKVI